MSPLQYWIWLTTRPGLSSVHTLRLLEQFGSPEQVYYAEPEEYLAVEGLSKKAQSVLLDKSLDQASGVLEDCDRRNLSILTLQDAQYPQRLRRIPDPPALLYVKGRNIRFDEEAAISVVGTRKPSPYGTFMAGRIGYDVTNNGGLLVSGIAQGIDTAALQGGLQGGGQVVSVLAGGIDVIYPRSSAYFYDKVVEAGALISEYPPGTRPLGAHFPIRNRIISGLSLAVVAVECGWHSGTMLTVNRALEQNRDVFALPGNVDSPTSDGPNRLIQQGAGLIFNGWDVLREYVHRYPNKLKKPDWIEQQTIEEGKPSRPQPKQKVEPAPSTQSEQEVESSSNPPLSPQQSTPQSTPEPLLIDLVKEPEALTEDQREIILTLGEQALLADDLVELTQIPTKRVLSALTLLQVQGYVEEGTGHRFKALVRLRLAEHSEG